MSTIKRSIAFDLETRLKELNLTAAERSDALAAAQTAERFVALVECVLVTIKRAFEAMTLKPSVRT